MKKSILILFFLFSIKSISQQKDTIRLSDIKHEDVESIIVLKDRNASQKYGEKGKNGVIEIYHKKK